MARCVFLSFVAEDLAYVNLFRGQAKNEKNDLEFSDYSVKEPFDSRNSDYIKLKIREQIRQASVTICLIGKTTHTSKWVDWEIKASVAMGKGLVGVLLNSSGLGFGHSFPIIPAALRTYHAEVVNWDAKAIVAAIERAAFKAALDKQRFWTNG